MNLLPTFVSLSAFFVVLCLFLSFYFYLFTGRKKMEHMRGVERMGLVKSFAYRRPRHTFPLELTLGIGQACLTYQIFQKVETLRIMAKKRLHP